MDSQPSGFGAIPQVKLYLKEATGQEKPISSDWSLGRVLQLYLSKAKQKSVQDLTLVIKLDYTQPSTSHRFMASGPSSGPGHRRHHQLPLLDSDSDSDDMSTASAAESTASDDGASSSLRGGDMIMDDQRGGDSMSTTATGSVEMVTPLDAFVKCDGLIVLAERLPILMPFIHEPLLNVTDKDRLLNSQLDGQSGSQQPKTSPDFVDYVIMNESDGPFVDEMYNEMPISTTVIFF